MSTSLATVEDYAYFDKLAPHRWPNKTSSQLEAYRELVDTGEIQIETLLENSLAVASDGLYTRVAQDSHDFSDFSDSKKVISQFRNNEIDNERWTNSFKISGIKNKVGLLRVVAYSRVIKEFFYFAIPNWAYCEIKSDSIHITLDRYTRSGTLNGIPRGSWTRFMVDSFERLATITEQEMNPFREFDSEIENIEYIGDDEYISLEEESEFNFSDLFSEDFK